MSHRATTRAPAKINLYLRVLGRRQDGFHEIETVFQAIDLCDEISVTLGGDGIGLTVDGPDLGPLEDNLAFRAAAHFVEAAGFGGGVQIGLRKRIPAGAGLGGGSSDAAAVLRALDALEPDALSGGELAAIAAALGSDVPFFLCGSTLAEGRGRGEQLTPWPPLEQRLVHLLVPPVHVATGPAYAALGREVGTLERSGRDSADAPAGWTGIAGVAQNDFEAVVAEAYPPVAEALAALRGAGYPLVMLSGSGGACFGLDPGDASASPRALSGPGSGWQQHHVPTLLTPPAVTVEE